MSEVYLSLRWLKQASTAKHGQKDKCDVNTGFRSKHVQEAKLWLITTTCMQQTSRKRENYFSTDTTKMEQVAAIQD